MSFIPKNQIIYKENIRKEENVKIDDEAMNKLNRIIGERKDLRNFLNEKLEGFEELEYKLNKIKPEKKEDSKTQEIMEKDNNNRKRAIYELLEFYKKANCDKSLKFKMSPFKPLIKPKIIQMKGRVLLNKTENL